jgi:hypothetical protein
MLGSIMSRAITNADEMWTTLLAGAVIVHGSLAGAAGGARAGRKDQRLAQGIIVIARGLAA